MDQSRVESMVAAHARPLANFLGLNDWTVRTRVRAMPNCAALCETQGEYRIATISFDPESVDNEDEFLDMLAHEMFHAFLWPMIHVEDVHQARIGDDKPTRAVSNEVFRLNNELLIANLLNLWSWYLRDAYLETRTRP